MGKSGRVEAPRGDAVVMAGVARLYKYGFDCLVELGMSLVGRGREGGEAQIHEWRSGSHWPLL
jgi:hypothetical protein